MKDAVGHSLREAWKEKGNPACRHAELSLERSFSGVATGLYICTTCGALIKPRSFTRVGEPDRADKGGSHETPV